MAILKVTGQYRDNKEIVSYGTVEEALELYTFLDAFQVPMLNGDYVKVDVTVNDVKITVETLPIDKQNEIV